MSCMIGPIIDVIFFAAAIAALVVIADGACRWVSAFKLLRARLRQFDVKEAE